MIYFFAFLLPSIIWLLSIIPSGIFPFGGNVIFTSDMLYQYTGYFEFIREVLTEGVSPFFSFYKGLGEETLGMISYYMMSPFNLIVALFPKGNISEAVLIINLMKIGACGLTFSIFIKNKFKNYDNKSLAVIAFSCCYALMAYNIAYQFNIMWLDAVVWLPIIMLGIERIIEKDKADLFYISLSIALISNWYTGFMICVFSALYVIYNLILNDDTVLIKRVLKKFLIFGILTACTAIIVIFPAALTCINETPRSAEIGESVISYTLIDIFSKFIIGSFDFSQITDLSTSNTYLNLPNLFAGTSVLILFILYFINNSVDKKYKLRDGIFGTVLVGLTLLVITNRMWHVFTYNVWFPYRYSFCLSFYMIYVAYKSFLELEYLELKKVWKAFFIIVAVCFVIEKLKYTYIISELIYCTIFMMFAFCIVIKLIKNNEKNAYTLMLLVVCVELFINTIIYVNKFSYFDRNEFYASRSILAEKIEEIEDNERYYRMENNLAKDYNLALGSNYLGIGSSSSMGKESSRGLLESLGYTRVANNSIKYSPTTKFADNFLGIKYYITDKIKKNDDALSLGFLVNNSILDIDNFLTEWGEHSNSFEKQNELIKKSTDIKEDLYKKISIFDVNLENLEKHEEGIYRKTYSGTKALYSFKFKANDESEIYLKVKGKTVNRARILVNGDELAKYMTTDSYAAIKLGSFKADEIVNVDIEFIYGDDIELEDVWVYSENIEVYKKVMAELKNGQLNIKNMTSSLIEGEITVNGAEQLLLLTIPYDTYLKVYIDGEQVETIKALDSLIAVKMDSGRHTIKVEYEPSYLIWIIGISGMAIILASILILCDKNRIIEK